MPAPEPAQALVAGLLQGKRLDGRRRRKRRPIGSEQTHQPALP